MRSEFFRFMLVGALNTFVSYLLFLALLNFLNYLLAYTISYCSGIMLSYFMNVLFVFKYRLSVTTFLKFPFVYGVQYAIGATTLWILASEADISPEIAIIGVIIVTIPVTFITSRFVLSKGN